MLYFIVFGASYLTRAASEIQLTLNVQDRVSYKEGIGAVLMCTVKGVTSGDPKFEWISSLNKVVTSTTKTDRFFLRNRPSSAWVKFNHIERIDAGTWECKMTVPGTNIVMSKKVQIETWKDLEFPNFKALQQPVIGTDALIECVVNSRPLPYVDWIIKGKYLYQLTGADKGRFHQEERGLRIQNITEADNGKYECEAIIGIKGSRQVRTIEVIVISQNNTGQKPTGQNKTGTVVGVSVGVVLVFVIGIVGAVLAYKYRQQKLQKNIKQNNEQRDKDRIATEAQKSSSKDSKRTKKSRT